MMVGVVYAIVLGLAIAGVWEGRGRRPGRTCSRRPRPCTRSTERVQVYPAEVRDRTRADVEAYASYVVHTEWSYMAEHGNLADEGGQKLEKIRRDVTDYHPRTTSRARPTSRWSTRWAPSTPPAPPAAQGAGATMPGVVWFGLITGALVTVGLIFTLQIRRTWRELLLAGLFSSLIAFLLFLIWDFDAPFGRGISATAGPFLRLFPGIG